MAFMNFRCLGGFLVGVICMGAAFADDADNILGFLRAHGQSEQSIQKFRSALDKAEEDESIAPLKSYLESSSPMLSFVAGLEALSLNPDSAVEAICGAVKSGKGNAPALLTTLSFDHERATIAWLIARLQTSPPEEQKRVIVFSLQVLTDQTYTEPSQWATWWGGDGKKFHPEPLDPGEQQSRMEAAAARLRIEVVENLVTKLKSFASGAKPDSTKPDSLSGVAKLLDGMAKAMELAKNLRLSAPAKAGDAAFSEGNLEEAAKAYRAAAEEDPGDTHSNYLLACILLETGKNQDAQAKFEEIAAENPEVTSAKFLAQVSARRQQNPGESMADTALNVWHEFKPKPGISLQGWDDPVMATLMGPMMTGGVFHIHVEKLDSSTSDPTLAVGAALIGPNALRIPALDRVLEKSPDCTVALAARALSSLRDEDKVAVPELLDRLARLDPDNSFPILLKIALENQLTRQQRLSKKKIPLPPAVIEETTVALQKKKFHDYRTLLCPAAAAALRKTGNPFDAVLLSYPSGLQSEFLNFLLRLADTAVQDFNAGNVEQGREVLALLQEIDRRTIEAKEPIMLQLITGSAAMIPEDALCKMEEKSGNKAAAAVLKKEFNDAKSRQPKSAQIRCTSIIFLPVPSLQNGLVERMTADEMGFIRSQPVDAK